MARPDWSNQTLQKVSSWIDRLPEEVVDLRFLMISR
jgi:hypothetical protein